MKKYLLSLLIVGLSFIGFSNSDYVFNASNTPTTITLEYPITEYGVVWSGVGDYNCSVGFGDTVIGGGVCKYRTVSGTNCDTYSPSANRHPSPEGPWKVVGFLSACLSKYPNWSLTLVSPPNTILPGGQSALSGVISGLTSSVNEFMPYVAYISLGILGALIGFVAIKRLINYVSRSVKSPFSSKKLRK